MAKTETTERTWNFQAMFSGDDDPKIASDRQAVAEATQAFAKKWRSRSKDLADPIVLLEALNEYEDWARRFGVAGDEAYYFDLKEALDQNDPKIKARVQSVTEFAIANVNQIQFFELELGKIKPDDQAAILKDKQFEPYRHFLESIFENAKYQLSEPEEKILNLKADTSYNRWVQMTSGFLAKEERQTLLENGQKAARTYEALISLCNSQDQKVRDEAAKNLNDILAKYTEVAEIELNAVMAHKKVNDELRGFERPDSSRHVSDDIPTEVVDTLIKSVSERNDIAQRYYRLKAKLLGKDRLAYHERNVMYGQVDQKFTYEDSIELIGRVFGRLDPFFAETLGNFDQAGQIDAFPKAGKRGGAFCTYNRIESPVYVLLNHTDDLHSLTTFAHEFGHAINDECMRNKVNSLNFGTPMATAEVASQFMEDFVLDELVEQAGNEETRLAIMMNRLNDAVSSIFRQIACYRFEQELHQQFRERGYLSKDDIGQIFQKNMVAYMGEAVEQSPGSENWWEYWSHIRTFFYVYAYAGGLLIAKAMQDQVRKDPKFIDQVKAFFSAGLSKSPVELFAEMGINIKTADFWQTGLDQVEQLLTDTEALAQKLGKI